MVYKYCGRDNHQGSRAFISIMVVAIVVVDLPRGTKISKWSYINSEVVIYRRISILYEHFSCPPTSWQWHPQVNQSNYLAHPNCAARHAYSPQVKQILQIRLVFLISGNLLAFLEKSPKLLSALPTHYIPASKTSHMIGILWTAGLQRRLSLPSRILFFWSMILMRYAPTYSHW